MRLSARGAKGQLASPSCAPTPPNPGASRTSDLGRGARGFVDLCRGDLQRTFLVCRGTPGAVPGHPRGAAFWWGRLLGHDFCSLLAGPGGIGDFHGLGTPLTLNEPSWDRDVFTVFCVLGASCGHGLGLTEKLRFCSGPRQKSGHPRVLVPWFLTSMTFACCLIGDDANP